ncbi:hypothetical protein [Bacillus sp. AFS037270]|uniref:hypothetical protein n=1 Tax=Bacillus sp. AFS037270 TaxID=2033499 RepID=UPI000BFB7BA8|nr:hypothetical protein [Bacillus sp. AFS037270]PGV51875.1 hypothetical protein COD92_12090 [Bacillus sp. AFS037270]
MKKSIHLFVYTMIFLVVLTSPFWLWKLQPEKKLNVLIVDKTVPNTTYREHKGLVWVLNNAKYFKNGQEPYSAKNDYKGFAPKKNQQYTIVPLPKDLKKYDVFYLTDQYGVYKNEFYGQNPTGRRSGKIYGGLTLSEVNQMKKALIQSKSKTLIAEFNTFASPTSEPARAEISNLLNVEWSGWIGRYFSDLNSNEVPQWVKQNYQKQREKWAFNGEGFVFVSKNNYVVVIGEDDVHHSGLNFKLTSLGQKHFSQQIDGTYQYWFDIIDAKNNNEILANYQLPVSKKASEKLKGYGIPNQFPAVIYHKNARYSSYYFSGDYADDADVPGIYQTQGLDKWKKTFGSNHSFYWTAYVPMMKDILKNGLKHVEKQEKIELVEENGVKTNSKTNASYIQIQKNGKWENFLIKGVNMGIGRPGYFPGEAGITKEEYFRWFQEIGAMNANAIRVYTLHPPQFYEAFYEYNQIAKRPLYLFHGTWVNEENLIKTQDAFAKVNVDDAKLEIKNMVDIIHGNANLAKRPGHASGVYKHDISKFVIGTIIGTEWDPAMVENTNTKHSGMAQFKGDYFETVHASPFEIWLAELMDYAAEYESKQYNWQHSMSFTNWVTTDLLKHPSEPLETEDMVSVDPNHVKASGSFKAGLFASYHIYPYYPDFLNYEKKYLDYTDAAGKKNNYAGYLNDLRSAHHMPILVAEFGVPSSRGLTHRNPYGMNQGFHSEEEQGQIDQHLYQSIVSEKYAGGLVFTWQDEWFKRTWNTMDFDNPDRRPYWNNQQTNEQHFGLLGFEPGKKETSIVVDGTSEDWEIAGTKLGYQSKGNQRVKEVRFASDSGYLYFLLKYNQPIDFNSGGTYLLLDTIGNQGQTTISINQRAKIKTDYGIDFLIKLQGPKDSRILVDSYYDTFYYQYGKRLKMIPEEPYAQRKDNGVFNPIRLALNKQQTIPSTKKVIPFQDYETGVLQYGNANPASKDFDSLTDISMSKDKKVIEGRIAWQLLNVKDPSLKEVMGDIWKQGLSSSVETSGIRAAVVTTAKGSVQQTIPKTLNGQLKQKGSLFYNWKPWDQPAFYERLKTSYEIIQKTFGTMEINQTK